MSTKNQVYRRSYTVEEFRDAVQNSTSIRQALSKLGLTGFGGAYKSFKRFAEKYGVDYSHFSGKTWNRGFQTGPKPTFPLQDVFDGKHPHYSTQHLKRRLITEGFLKNECAVCGIHEWLGQPLSLHLDHIDGVNTNHALKNLRLLCPNCHSQTATYAGRNNRKTL